jgi:hypothetical protein
MLPLLALSFFPTKSKDTAAFFSQFCGDHQQEYLAKFGNIQNAKVEKS